MAYEPGTGTRTAVSPEDAFSLLGDGTRLEILRTLGEADGPLQFTELRERVGLGQGENFNYHLDKLVEHFAEKTDEGYGLRRPGERVVEAVLSETVTETPIVERTRIDQPCHFCGAPIEVQYGQGHVEMFCSQCEGGGENGYLGKRFLPPAGIRGRTPEELFAVAFTWTMLDIFAIGSRICPRCSASLDRSRTVRCERHDTTDGGCGACDSWRGVLLQFDCRNCIFETPGALNVHLAAETELLAFLATHGVNPVVPAVAMEVQRVYSNYDERVVSTAPLEVDVTFSIDEDALTLTMDDDLAVVETTRHHAAASP